MEKHLNRFLPKVDIAQYLLNIPNKCTGSYRTIRAKGHVFHSIFPRFWTILQHTYPKFPFCLIVNHNCKGPGFAPAKETHFWASLGSQGSSASSETERLIHFQSSSME